MAAWALGISAATALRYEVIPAEIDWSGVPAMVVLAVTVHLLIGAWFGLYSGRRVTGSFDEVSLLFSTVLVTTTVITFIDLMARGNRLIPLSSSVAGGVLAFVGICGTRFLWRTFVSQLRRPAGDGATRIVVIGAGEAGQEVVNTMLTRPDSPYLPVALIDDDRSKVKLEVRGVPVLGSTADLGEVAEMTGAQAALIALPGADGPLVRRLSRSAHAAGLSVHVLPPVNELLTGGIQPSDVRALSPVDLLGREEVNTNVQQIAGYLTGQRVLVTGAGGSIGSELCRQIRRFAPASLVMLDRDEAALHSVQLSLDGRGLLDSSDLELCDIRDRAAVERVMRRHRPQVVFHAAALKHLPLLERFPEEAVRTNVWATLDLLAIAAEHEVEHFVNISTDKAADPTSVLGYTKRIAERLTSYVGPQASGTFVSVRFGNVLGSRGSVLGAFEGQIAAGGPLTVTHPEVTRYFMTVEEACQLVIQAGAIGVDGEALVLDMGEPVRIAEVAQTLADQASRPVDVVYTGLRPGEKLHEQLFANGEQDHRPHHQRVSHVQVPPLAPERARGLDLASDTGALVQALLSLCDNPGARALTPGATEPLDGPARPNGQRNGERAGSASSARSPNGRLRHHGH